jgi:DNA replication and repair protein RecF
LFSPEDTEIVKGDPSNRRKFFDLLISQLKPSYMYQLQQYYKILEQRNNLLKRGKFSNISLELDIWDEKLAELNLIISKTRKEVVEIVKPLFQKYVGEFSKGKETVNINYKTYVDENILKSMEQKRMMDIERGFTSIGIHRDDYKFEINGDALENFGSQGQIKTVILSLKLAQKEIIEEKLNEKPIMLLDDVMSELDKNRREYILTKIQDCQIIITCTDIEDIELDENTKNTISHRYKAIVDIANKIEETFKKA